MNSSALFAEWERAEAAWLEAKEAFAQTQQRPPTFEGEVRPVLLSKTEPDAETRVIEEAANLCARRYRIMQSAWDAFTEAKRKEVIL